MAITIKICPECNRSFESTKNREIYCSDKCRTTARRKQKRKYPKVCVVCGKPFMGLREDSKACSKVCLAKYISLIDREDFTHKCENCGKEFTSHTSRARFCCAKCRYEGYKKQKLEEKEQEKNRKDFIAGHKQNYGKTVAIDYMKQHNESIRKSHEEWKRRIASEKRISAR